jgi:hypothetical protein
MNLTFAAQDKDGKPANDLEPYMEMAGHAEFVNNDLSVFAHVHPAGSVSMAALEPARGPTEEAAGMPMATLVANVPLAPKVSFPSCFPRAGEYRIFVQIKRGGRVETGVFDAVVRQNSATPYISSRNNVTGPSACYSFQTHSRFWRGTP